MSEITRYPRYRVIAGLEQDLHGMMTRPGGFMYDKAEYAIVQAAAEITGLTTEWANWAQTCVLTEHTGEKDDRADDCPECGLTLAALRRYAELAK